ncbi:prostate-associated microseminoprotein [Erpetoichthys calabaricus]|uniref:Microseminoprotein, prostate associated 2 n=1 Tax=Erpetoichthys calabaricus TaxID=27687 RepID=A0A8C4X8Q5_ERPCA|nr:prostate-associated microseminoprotein [Erpetoichthys calabaricus]
MGRLHGWSLFDFLNRVFLISMLLPCLATYTSGECYFNAKGTCEYKSQVFGFGETWLTKDCYQCICLKPFGVGCCDDGQQPVDYPEWCEVIRKPDTCSVAVVMRGNNKIPCIDNPILNHLHGSEKQAWKEPNDPLF